jgi:hypothetical protein
MPAQIMQVRLTARHAGDGPVSREYPLPARSPERIVAGYCGAVPHRSVCMSRFRRFPLRVGGL